MGIAMGWVLALVGPLWAAMRPWLPGAAALRTFGVGAVVVVLLAAGVGLVWLLRDLSERDAVATKAQAIVERANLAAENTALKAAARQAADTLKHREDAIAAGEAEIETLRQQLKEKRDASPNPETLVVPPGDPWLGGPAAGVRKRP